MMGRTSAILTTDSTVLDEQLLISNPNSLEFCQELGLLESARAFSFLERTVNEVSLHKTDCAIRIASAHLP
jgi:ethanolamine utilization microcompartment shell protein EutS